MLLPAGGSSHLVEGKVDGTRIEGTIEVQGRGKLPFSAIRIAEAPARGWP